MTNLKLKSLKIAATLAVLTPGVALAQVQPVDVSTPGQLESIIGTVAAWFFRIFIALAVIFIIWGAFLYLTAAGDEEKHGRAKTAIVYAIVAIVIALIAGGVTSIIENILNEGAGAGI